MAHLSVCSAGGVNTRGSLRGSIPKIPSQMMPRLPRAQIFNTHRLRLWKAPGKFSLVLLTVLLAAGCVQTGSLLQTEGLSVIPRKTRVLLLPTDIELYEVTAAGLLEPKAEWTNLAKTNVEEALRAELLARDDILSVYREPADKQIEHLHRQLFKLHRAVGQAIVRHKVLANQSGQSFELPTKKGRFDWSLGSATNSMRQDDADYGLFVYIRDSYTSAGRAAVIFTAALLQNFLPGGRLSAFASLVDLKTGNIVWFNLLNVPSGDLRTAEAARETMSGLLKDLPL